MVTRNKIPNQILKNISAYAQQNKEEEVCGILIDENDNIKFIECENIAQDKKFYFQIDPCVFIDYNIQAVVHSHCVGTARPSGHDKQCSNSMNAPFLIYSVLYDNFCLYENKSVTEFKV